MMYAHTVACSYTYQHAIIDTEADSCLEASSTCDFHLDAFQTLNPPVQGSSNSICDPHLFIGGSCLQSQTLSNSACHLIHLAMDPSPQELQLERDLRRMRSEIDSGEVRTDSGRWNYLLAQVRLSDDERLAHRAERQQDVPVADRSRSPILRRARRQLNRLMRGAEAEEEPLPGPGLAMPKTPPKAPPANAPVPVAPKTPPKKPSAPTPATGSAHVRPHLPFSLDPNLLGTMITPPSLLAPITGDGKAKMPPKPPPAPIRGKASPSPSTPPSSPTEPVHDPKAPSFSLEERRQQAAGNAAAASAGRIQQLLRQGPLRPPPSTASSSRDVSRRVRVLRPRRPPYPWLPLSLRRPKLSMLNPWVPVLAMQWPLPTSEAMLRSEQQFRCRLFGIRSMTPT